MAARSRHQHPSSRSLAAILPIIGLLLLLGGGFGLCLAACDRSAEEPAAGAPEAVDWHSYTVRGRIEMLPVDGKPATELQIRHEHIPDFRDKTGAVHANADGVPGMKAMTMPFPVKSGVSLDGLAVGDIVEFEFEASYSNGPAWRVTRIAKLPPDTVLDFGVKAVPNGGN